MTNTSAGSFSASALEKEAGALRTRKIIVTTFYSHFLQLMDFHHNHYNFKFLLKAVKRHLAKN